MEQRLTGKCIAILVADGFAQEQMTAPKEILERSGAFTVLVSAATGATVKGSQEDEFFIDRLIVSVDPAEYDALLVPGGIPCCDTLCESSPAADFARGFLENGKVVAAVGEGVRFLQECGVTGSRAVASEEGGVVTDGRLVTAHGLEDLPDFINRLVDVFAESGTPPSATLATANA